MVHGNTSAPHLRSLVTGMPGFIAWTGAGLGVVRRWLCELHVYVFPGLVELSLWLCCVAVAGAKLVLTLIFFAEP